MLTRRVGPAVALALMAAVLALAGPGAHASASMPPLCVNSEGLFVVCGQSGTTVPPATVPPTTVPPAAGPTTTVPKTSVTTSPTTPVFTAPPTTAVTVPSSIKLPSTATVPTTVPTSLVRPGSIRSTGSGGEKTVVIVDGVIAAVALAIAGAIFVLRTRRWLRVRRRQ